MNNQSNEKQRFESRFQNLNISPEEMDRRYRQHLSEQFERERLGMVALMEAARGAGESGSVSAIGGGVQEESSGLIIYSTDFTNGQAIDTDTNPIGTNGVDGFQNTAAQTNFYDGYYAYGLTPEAVDKITAAVEAAGLDSTNSVGYVWNATWGSGSTITTGLIKFGYYAPGSYFYVQTIDTSDPTWQTPGVNSGTTLAGTFLFPLTITIYTPLISKGSWC